jgi:peptidoglycan/LPS O-acetylase OafA/YrhL
MMNTREIQRRYDLDWLRVLAILAIFVYHCTRLFDTDGWHIKNPTTYLWITVWKEFATSWGMPLILIISGASVYFALGKVSAGKYVKGLFARLFVPLVVGMLTHAALQVYLEKMSKGTFSGSFWQFYPHYFDGMYGFGGNFAWMGLHLWYLELLFILSLLLLPLFLWLMKTRSGSWFLDRLGNFLAVPGAVFLLALPAVLLIIQLDPTTWGNKDLGGWSIFIYPFFFISGFVIISNQRLQARVRQMRWLSLGLGLILTPIYLFLKFQSDPALHLQVAGLLDPLICLVGWTWLLTVLGFGMQHLNFNTPFLKYANEAVLPFYILHQTVIVILSYFVVGWAIPDWLKFVFILLASFVVTMLTYEYLVRRINVLRFPFGMKMLPKAPAEQPREAAQPSL